MKIVKKRFGKLILIVLILIGFVFFYVSMTKATAPPQVGGTCSCQCSPSESNTPCYGSSCVVTPPNTNNCQNGYEPECIWCAIQIPLVSCLGCQCVATSGCNPDTWCKPYCMNGYYVNRWCDGTCKTSSSPNQGCCGEAGSNYIWKSSNYDCTTGTSGIQCTNPPQGG